MSYKYNMSTGEIHEGDVLLGTFIPASLKGCRMRMLSLVINANQHERNRSNKTLDLAELAKDFVAKADSLLSPIPAGD